MDLDTFSWFAVWLVVGLVALAATVHVAATDQGLASIRAMLRRVRTRRSNHHAASTVEGHDDHDHD